MTRRRILEMVCVVHLTAIAMPAAAQQDVAAAKRLFDQGLADMQAGKHDTGCPALAESQRLDPRPGTLFTLAFCESSWGHVATADARLDEYIRLYDRLPPDQQARQGDRRTLAKEERDRLAPDIPELTMTLAPGAPSRTVVKRDGQVIGAAAMGMALPVDPGAHVLTTQAPGGPVWEQHITTAKGEKKSVVLEVKPPPPVVPSTPGPPIFPSKNTRTPPVEQSSGSGRKMAAYAIGGVGLAGLAVGGLLGGLVISKKGALDQHCGKAIGSSDPTACDDTGLDAAQSIKSLGLGSTIAFALGAVGLGTAAVLYFTAPETKNTRAGSNAAWISAGVLSVGPGGVLVGSQGAF
ncbi:hypothetical protein [Polyangium mundeleinium]|uniref:Uncharacterized protein n=1 Tax=Polyangium mundeleinium TaxID=2995306 RepID=A0ABT5ENU4_9BACT|nr:hypothetical protein [Polyangium mundeleinium]MDC0743124.1 hypothetical protein [Polyangium mundeleinium]